ncbi:MAG: aspartate/glutamate racemase family protein [Pyrinomonadaceae bacterium]|nr:aspartate/glutamate racemase family protein [Pyrinomonadaceae bacterium]
MRLGIIDWGIGGVSIYRLIKERLGDIPVTYFSDTGVTPYGKMSRAELVGRLNDVIGYLKSRGVTHIVVGCNAASTALPYIDSSGLTIEGVIGPAITFTAKLKPAHLGVVGGRRTILSGVYRRGFNEKGISVIQRIAQPLSGLIESGDTGSDTLRAEAKRILAPMCECSHVLLACTHYPAITPILREFVSPDTKFIDPAAKMVNIVRQWRLPTGGRDEFLTSGDTAAMKRAARNAFGIHLPQRTQRAPRID